ncbi:MgtC/SapB family protein [Belliella kenyensis]|uniref:Protein MgtC n=1 Tax=Belliella kenyensis TaxID=1472724 RepID=A0ABV8EQP8_9BACT|nr:MgtC/SapB family protein [Belliella kenyensis]MCH7401530.1 MgtC/SapB family protein [Belliella kenyensis]MDN3603190.1 MgtC/SapB family protein [Belliella kenyensis]
MTLLEFGLRLGLAFSLGAAIGIERQYRQKSAGLRTNTLVAMGAAAFILLSVSLTGDSGDPSRVAGQIVTGIGFLGAGVIMKDGFNVQGLNTAATIWCSAAVGSLSGVGLYPEAVITAGAVMLAHLGLRPIGRRVSAIPELPSDVNSGTFFYSFQIKCLEKVENHLRVMMLEIIKSSGNLRLQSLKSFDNGDPSQAYVEAKIVSFGNNDVIMETLAGKLLLEYGVMEVTWEIEGQQNDR